MLPTNPRSIALIACRVLEREIATLLQGTSHVVRHDFFEIGLHDQPRNLRTRLAAAIAAAESDRTVDAVVLVYGLCGLALVDLTSRRCPIVLPRAHDCLTLLLGSKERYSARMSENPATYWYSPGWNRDGRVAGPDREAKLRTEYTARFGSPAAEDLLAMERTSFAQYTSAAYVDFGLPGDEAQRHYARRCADSLGWKFDPLAGDPTLLRDLLHGPWDPARFLVLQPGERIAHTAGPEIVKAVPAQP